MPLWSNTDEAASAPANKSVDITNGNTGIQAFESTPVGTWGVDANEAIATNVNGHAGWVLRKVGSGGRAGRVTEETLVAMGSMTGDSEDTVYPDTTITITTQPQNVSNGVGNVATFTVVASANPSATLSYQWTGPQGNLGTNSSTLTISNLESANAGGYYVTVSATGANSVKSANGTLTVA